MSSTTNIGLRAPEVARMMMVDFGRPQQRPHQVVAEAMKMCARGDGDPTVMGRLRSGGLNEVQVASTFDAIKRQLAFKRSTIRRTRGRTFASVYLQLLVAVLLITLTPATMPIPAALLLGSSMYRGWVRLNPTAASPYRRAYLAR